jgi:hypothetical protein
VRRARRHLLFGLNCDIGRFGDGDGRVEAVDISGLASEEGVSAPHTTSPHSAFQPVPAAPLHSPRYEPLSPDCQPDPTPTPPLRHDSTVILLDAEDSDFKPRR